MKQAASNLIRRLWRYCGILRDDGLSYPDYVEQLTYLLFLKMADEGKGTAIPPEYGWRSFAGRDAADLHRHYARVLEALGRQPGTLGLIYRNAKNKIKDPAKLRLLVEELIGRTEWSELSSDVKGDAYEGLLEKNAQDTKSGAGQYFTPRVVIDAIVECVQPQLDEVICDPACGTAGFLLAAHQYLRTNNPKLSKSQERWLSTSAFRGIELVEEVARLATMNLLLHGIGDNVSDADLPVICADSLKDPPKISPDVVLTNPPFGTRGSVTFAQRQDDARGSELTIVRPDFWVKTANKQLNFVQHVVSTLRPGGRAAMVVPDNVLFESGAAAQIRRRLLEQLDLHTILRLPTGLFYAQGVKANVLFFDKIPPSRSARLTRCLWVYNLRGKRVSLKQNPLRREDLDEFIRCYFPGRRERRSQSQRSRASDRWRSFAVRELLERDDVRLDLSWVTGPPADVRQVRAELDSLAMMIESELRDALARIVHVSAANGTPNSNSSRQTTEEAVKPTRFRRNLP